MQDVAHVARNAREKRRDTHDVRRTRRRPQRGQVLSEGSPLEAAQLHLAITHAPQLDQPGNRKSGVFDIQYRDATRGVRRDAMHRPARRSCAASARRNRLRPPVATAARSCSPRRWCASPLRRKLRADEPAARLRIECERRDVDETHAGAGARRRQRGRRAVVHPLVGRAAALAQDADAIDDGIDGVDERDSTRPGSSGPRTGRGERETPRRRGSGDLASRWSRRGPGRPAPRPHAGRGSRRRPAPEPARSPLCLSVISVLTEIYVSVDSRSRSVRRPEQMSADSVRLVEQGADTPPIPLSAVGERFVLHWGEMGSRWGVNRTESQIHALIYLVGRPLHAEEIAATLARRPLEREHEPARPPALEPRSRRAPHGRSPRSLRDRARSLGPPAHHRARAQDARVRSHRRGAARLRERSRLRRGGRRDAARLAETLALMEALSSWSEDMLRLDTATLTRLMKMGDKVRALLPRGKSAGKR